MADDVNTGTLNQYLEEVRLLFLQKEVTEKIERRVILGQGMTTFNTATMKNPATLYCIGEKYGSEDPMRHRIVVDKYVFEISLQYLSATGHTVFSTRYLGKSANCEVANGH